jgi:hypothetical protein
MPLAAWLDFVILLKQREWDAGALQSLSKTKSAKAAANDQNTFRGHYVSPAFPGEIDNCSQENAVTLLSHEIMKSGQSRL